MTYSLFLLSFLGLLTLSQVLIGVALMLIWRRLKPEEKEVDVSIPKHSYKKLDLGQRKQAPDMGYPDDITQDERAWAYENGANSENDVIALIEQNKQEEALK